ncbi:glutathione synthase [gamma proteobacterium HTCC5015]|nr:glutathione synthase [gamma proteobacterium HTCC5015]
MSSARRIVFLMDPIEDIKPHKDSTLAMMLAAQARDWQVHYATLDKIYMDNGTVRAEVTQATVFDDQQHWYSDQRTCDIALGEIDIIMMRKDPPFDSEYLYCCHLLEFARRAGAVVVNHPEALCNINEKLLIGLFPEYCTPTLVTRQTQAIRSFLDTHEDAILKPLDGMGGASIFRLRKNDSNVGVILETMSQNSQRLMVQRYLPDIKQGDKRILLINGQAVDYALARIPTEGENRGNLAAGGRGEARPLTQRDREIAAAVGPELVRRGVIFAGLDVIGDYLTEVNVTSPTCIRELDAQCNLDIAGDLLDAIDTQYFSANH